jgi:hypothetical protein
MKKLLVSLLALSMIVPISVKGLEKSGEPSDDFETLRIEKMRGENPKYHVLQAKLIELKKAKKEALTDVARQKIQADITKLEADLAALL